MPVIGQTTLQGASGQDYAFKVFTAETRLNDFIPGIYAVVKQTDDGDGASSVDEVLFIGTSQNVDLELQKHDKRSCFEDNGFNAICLHRTANNDTHKAVAEDLLGAISPTCS